MAETPSIADPGAPIAKDAIDPELVKLSRTRAKIGVITALGIVSLCVYFLLRLGPDRRFGGASEAPTPATVADVLAGKVDDDSFIALDAEPLMAHAIRVVKAKGDIGWRVTPARGTGEQLWLVMSGDGWEPPTTKQYQGRLRKLGDLQLAPAVTEYAAAHPRPVFATAAAVRAAFGGTEVATVTGDRVAVTDKDTVAFDVIDPRASTIVVTFTRGTVDHAPLLDADAWGKELVRLGIPAKLAPTPANSDAVLGQARFDVPLPVAEVTPKLEGAKLWAARVDAVTRHYQTTWGALRGSPAGTLRVDGNTVAEAQVELVGLHVAKGIPDSAYALLVGEVPQDYWYVLPITLALLGIGLLFAWALVRAVRRDLLPTRA